MKRSSNSSKHAAATPTEEQPAKRRGGLTWMGKLGVFVIAPLCVGVCGLYGAYLQTLTDKTREISIDRDFIMPTILCLALVIVVGFQTGGFRTEDTKRMIQWPKVKRVKTIVYKKKEH